MSFVKRIVLVLETTHL